MEQITLTKQELIEIVEREVSKRLDGKKPINSNSIFNNVKIKAVDFEEINKEFDFTEHFFKGKSPNVSHSISLNKYQHGLGCYEHYKSYPCDVHDLIRKLTLSIFGVTLNSDLSEVEYSQAAKTYKAIKEFYLHLYKNRLSKLTIEDFKQVRKEY
ncbi:hypothetical protein [Staphylococcus ratti]|uniref:Phage protein n=1 Tax=Staphylococcus ratti TaxID=2892440 RepID=A0ABY3PBN9_9STAP|nr:hypothetical protein [Staphylococcus ratti]UEX89724.1 hypothetical protein LN051_09155 [Staphylococcus ratti]